MKTEEGVNFNTLNDLYSAIKLNGINIYGTGYVAKRFVTCLKKLDFFKYVKNFVVTNAVNISYEGVEVKTIDSLNSKSELICIAVHESSKDEIITLLQKKGFTNFVWIYPFLWRMMCGNPVLQKIQVPLKNIWIANKDYYLFAFRYLAIEQFYGKNSYGFDIYLKCLSLFQSLDSAEKRLHQFIKLIESYDKQGYNQTCPSSILENNLVIDGTHRIALNMYHHNTYAVCDIFSNSIDYFSVHDEKTLIPKSVFQSFDSHTKDKLNDANYNLAVQFEG
ncbi:MAG: hypothetical protein K6E51_14780 [Treponema sp.]|nr:hypothetical protein [Treponema sp.]